MIKFYGTYAKIQEIENKISDLNNLIDEMYDNYDMDGTSHYETVVKSLERELVTLKRNRIRGGLICRCM